MKWKVAVLASAIGCMIATGTAMTARAPAVTRATDIGWSVVGGGYDNAKYSTLTQITPANVARLEVAWEYETGEAFEGSEMQTNPIVIGRVLYAITPKQRLIALDAANGRLIWKYDPHQGKDYTGPSRNRGVAYWSDGGQGTIFYTVGSKLFAIDATTGSPRPGFGENGRVDLRHGLGLDPQAITVSATSAGVVYKDLLIIGSAVPEDLPSAPGDIRAFDVRTGKLRWSFKTIPDAGQKGSDTWPAGARRNSGGANSWAGLSLDVARGLVFAPTGSAAYDFYGGDRIGDNLHANSLLALRAETGELVWSFQTVRHDLWDRDLPAAPTLLRLRRDGEAVDAVAQITKTGYVFVFERATGKPLFPIVEMKVPASDVPGESAAATQPVPLLPQPFARQRLTPVGNADVLARIKRLRHGNLFLPPSTEGTIVFPGFDGGGEWGGAAFDPESALLYVNSNEMPWVLRLVKRDLAARQASTGRGLYEQNCAGCHRADLRGTPPQFPSLHRIARRLPIEEIEARIRQGSPRMPAFAALGDEAIKAIATYLARGESKEILGEVKSLNRLPYTHDGYNKLLDANGYPAIAPPWGTLSAIDMNSGLIRWQVPLGEIPGLKARGAAATGSENYGGPVVTAGGLLFIAATTHDRKFRAFDKGSGRLLWETTLPAAGLATPAIYSVAGRQFVVIAAGGGKWGQPSGGKYIAFALRRQ